MSNEQEKEPTGDETEGRTVPLNELEPDDIQPVDDAEGWEVDGSHNFVGTPVAVERDDGTVDEGRIAAIWTFRGQAGPRRRGPSRTRGPVQRGDRKCRVPITCQTRGGRTLTEGGLAFKAYPAVRQASTRQEKNTHPRLAGVGDGEDWNTFSFLTLVHERFPRERKRCPEPRRPARSPTPAVSTSSSSGPSGRPAASSHIHRRRGSA